MFFCFIVLYMQKICVFFQCVWIVSQNHFLSSLFSMFYKCVNKIENLFRWIAKQRIIYLKNIALKDVYRSIYLQCLNGTILRKFLSSTRINILFYGKNRSKPPTSFGNFMCKNFHIKCANVANLGKKNLF